MGFDTRIHLDKLAESKKARQSWWRPQFFEDTMWCSAKSHMAWRKFRNVRVMSGSVSVKRTRQQKHVDLVLVQKLRRQMGVATMTQYLDRKGKWKVIFGQMRLDAFCSWFQDNVLSKDGEAVLLRIWVMYAAQPQGRMSLCMAGMRCVFVISCHVLQVMWIYVMCVFRFEVSPSRSARSTNWRMRGTCWRRCYWAMASLFRGPCFHAVRVAWPCEIISCRFEFASQARLEELNSNSNSVQHDQQEQACSAFFGCRFLAIAWWHLNLNYQR